MRRGDDRHDYQKHSNAPQRKPGVVEEVQLLRARLADATRRADLAEKSSRDAWSFAKVALRTGRPKPD